MIPLTTPKYAGKSLNKLSWLLLWGSLGIYLADNIYAHYFVWLFVLACFLLSVKNLKRLNKLISQGRYQAKLKRQINTVTDNHGSARWATEEDIRNAGLDNPNQGVPIGVLGDCPLFFNYTHALVQAAAGGGKTISAMLTAILHGYRVELSDGTSYAAPMINIDVKPELSPMTKALIENLHGHTVVCLNPALKNGLEDVGCNPLYPVIDDLADPSRHRFAISDATEIVMILLPEPAGGEDRNKYWRNGSRNIIIVIIIYLAGVVPSDCHLGRVFEIVSKPKLLMKHLTEASRSAMLSGDLRTIALGILETPEERLAEFVSGAIQVIQPFSKSSDLGQSVSRDGFRFEDIRNKKQLTSVFIIAPYEQRTAYATWTALVVKTATKALMRMGDNSPITLNLDEATNFNLEAAGIAQDLTALRGFGLRCRLLIQAKSEALRVVGKNSTDTIYSQTDLKQFFKVTSYQEAKEISDYLGEYTVKIQSIGPDGTTANSDNKPSWSEAGKSLYRPEDILNMAEDEQIVIIYGLPPIKCKRLPYNHVRSWHDMLDDNPLEGGKLPLDPTFDITYREVKK